MTKNYVSLHTHCRESILDGISKREDLIKLVKERGELGISCTDHGNMYNVVSFYKNCTEAGIVPIIGCEFYVAPDSRFNRSYAKKGEAEEDAKNGDLTLYAYHLTVLAKNRAGYESLKRLSSESYSTGFYRKSRIDSELLTAHKDGLIVLSGCLAGKIARLIIAGNKQAAIQEIDQMRATFKENFYLEVMAHGIDEEKVVREVLIETSKTHGIPLVMTGDSHFTNQSDEYAHEVALAIGTRKLMKEDKRFKFNGSGYWFKTAEEMYDAAAEAGIPDEALENTVTICKSIEDYGIELASKTKKFKVPLFRDDTGKIYTDMECHELLEIQAWQGLSEKGLIDKQEYKDRLLMELDLIKRKNFSSYFLIIADIVNWMRNQDIVEAPGRGSSMGSLVCYSLAIIGLDPIEYNIPFSRFINEGRKDLPDVDTDISQEHRGRVLKYISNKYGADRVAHIVTFQSMRPKAALDNVGRTLDVPHQIRKDATGDLHDDPTSDDTLMDLINVTPTTKAIVDSVPDWLQVACTLEGNYTTVSSHAAGIVISNEPLIEHTPMMRNHDDGIPITQYDMVDIAELGLLKLDMLGLKTLDVIHNTLKLVETKTGEKISWLKLKPTDPETFKLIASGKYVSVFQYDSAGMRGLARSLAPDTFEHLIAINALYRPGPMKKPAGGGKSILEMYIDRRHGREALDTWHSELDAVFKPTLGVLLFQEQLMSMAQVIAGFNEVEADEYRAAVGKKNVEAFKKAQTKFIEHGVLMGRGQKMMEGLADKLTGFARYAWGRGHALTYSFISYVTAWLETHYPCEYYTTLMNTEVDSKKMKVYIASILQRGVQINPPHVNLSRVEPTTDGKSIFMGLSAVRNLGDKAQEAIMSDRNTNGPYIDYLDFNIRLRKFAASVNKTIKENLVKARAFDWDATLSAKDKIENTEAIKKTLDKFMDKVDDPDILRKQVEAKLAITGQEYDTQRRLAFELSVLSFYISSHPVTEYSMLFNLFPHINYATPSQLQSFAPGTRLAMVGAVDTKALKLTKNNKPYLDIRLSDQMDAIVQKIWSPLASEVNNSLVPGQLAMLFGETRDDLYRPGEVQLSVSKVLPLHAIGGIPITSIHGPDEATVNQICTLIGAVIGQATSNQAYKGTIAVFSQTAYIKPQHYKELKTYRGINYGLAL